MQIADAAATIATLTWYQSSERDGRRALRISASPFQNVNGILKCPRIAIVDTKIGGAVPVAVIQRCAGRPVENRLLWTRAAEGHSAGCSRTGAKQSFGHRVGARIEQDGLICVRAGIESGHNLRGGYALGEGRGLARNTQGLADGRANWNRTRTRARPIDCAVGCENA